MKNKCENFANYCPGPAAVCPECGSYDYEEEGDWQAEEDKAWIVCKCDDCQAKFDKVFLFIYTSGYKMIEGELKG